MKQLKLICAAGVMAVCLVLVAFLRTVGAQQELDPLKVCADTQRLLFENNFVRVTDIRVPPGGSEPLHRHMHGVVINLTEGTMEQTAGSDRKKTRTSRKAGDAIWSEAVIHEAENVGTTPVHQVRIELKY